MTTAGGPEKHTRARNPRCINYRVRRASCCTARHNSLLQGVRAAGLLRDGFCILSMFLVEASVSRSAGANRLAKKQNVGMNRNTSSSTNSLRLRTPPGSLKRVNDRLDFEMADPLMSFNKKKNSNKQNSRLANSERIFARMFTLKKEGGQ